MVSQNIFSKRDAPLSQFRKSFKAQPRTELLWETSYKAILVNGTNCSPPTTTTPATRTALLGPDGFAAGKKI